MIVASYRCRVSFGLGGWPRKKDNRNALRNVIGDNSCDFYSISRDRPDFTSRERHNSEHIKAMHALLFFHFGRMAGGDSTRSGSFYFVDGLQESGRYKNCLRRGWAFFYFNFQNGREIERQFSVNDLVKFKKTERDLSRNVKAFSELAP